MGGSSEPLDLSSSLHMKSQSQRKCQKVNILCEDKLLKKLLVPRANERAQQVKAFATTLMT